MLDVIRDEGLQHNARCVGGEMLAGLRSLANRHEAVGNVRGAGLFLGVDLVTDRATKQPDGALAVRVVNRLREKRVLISASGAEGNVLKIRPPLPFTSADAAEFLAALDETLTEQP